MGRITIEALSTVSPVIRFVVELTDSSQTSDGTHKAIVLDVLKKFAAFPSSGSLLLLSGWKG
jgi:hypothetical protein